MAFNNVFSTLKHATLVACLKGDVELVLCESAGMDYKNDALNTFNEKYVQGRGKERNLKLGVFNV